MFRIVGSALFWTFALLSSMAIFPIAVLCWGLSLPFDPRKVILHRFTCFWASLFTWLNPAWPIEIIGREKIDPKQTYVMVANHQSLLDILVLYRLFTHFKWVSKSEIFKIPLIGWNMRLNDYVELQRGDRTSVTAMLLHCRKTLSSGSSIMMFPEGTRSPDGRLRRFKEGAFDLAIAAQRPLLPIVVHGTASALPKKGLVLQGRHRIKVNILDPISFESFANTSGDDLAVEVRELIASHLKTAQ